MVPGSQQSQPSPNGIWPYSVAGDYGKISVRMSPYHRMDIGIQFHKKLKVVFRTFEVSIYNVYSRPNPLLLLYNYDQNSKRTN